jgi:hypothetical protein
MSQLADDLTTAKHKQDNLKEATAYFSQRYLEGKKESRNQK